MNKVIVSIASWPPRIKYVEGCVRSLLDQSRVPDAIEVNLSRVEFPNGLEDLPDGLRRLIAEGKVSVNWEKGNTFCFRKEIPCVKRHCGEDFIMLSCDDDCLYSHGYVERILSNLGDFDAYCSEPGVVGNRMAYRGRIFNPDFWELLTQEVIDCGISDTWAAIYLLKKRARCKWQRDSELDGMVKDCGASGVSANSERIGGYTTERMRLADTLSRKALGI